MDIDSSFRCSGGILVGAFIIRSTPCWLSGNGMISRTFSTPARSMTIRSILEIRCFSYIGVLFI